MQGSIRKAGSLGRRADVEWAVFDPFISAIHVPGGRRAADHLRVLDGVPRDHDPPHRFPIRAPPERADRARPWQDLPEEVGKSWAVCPKARRWKLREEIPEILNRSDAVPDSVQMVDSTIIRAQPCAAGQAGGWSSGSGPFEIWRHDRGPFPDGRPWPVNQGQDHAATDLRLPLHGR